MDEAGTDDTVLVAYLQERDATCPLCGYNLRSFTRAACPECGAPLGIGLHDRSSLRRRRGLLLLLFAWLLLAGGMNAARAGRGVYHSCRGPSWQSVVTNWSTTPSQAVAPATIVRPDQAALDDQFGTRWYYSGNATWSTSRASPPTFAIRGAGWGNVTPMQWISVAGWSLLVAIALLGLLTLLRYRRRPAPARAARALTSLVWIAFSGYLIAHAVAFARIW